MHLKNIMPRKIIKVRKKVFIRTETRVIKPKKMFRRMKIKPHNIDEND